MAKNYTYPRVTLSQYAKTRSSVAPAAEDTTVLFMPFIAEKGPIAEKEYNPIHSLSEFIDKFGNLKYEDNGQTALIIYNWLSSGGTLYPYRLDNYETAALYTGSVSYEVKSETVTKEFKLQAKHKGLFYNNIRIVINGLSSELFRVDVKYVDNSNVVTTIESFRISKGTYEKDLSASDFIEICPIDDKGETGFAFKDLSDCFLAGKTSITLKVDTGTDTNTESKVKAEGADLYSLVKSLWASTTTGEGENAEIHEPLAYEILLNQIESPVDIIMDAGYPKDIKNAMVAFVNNQPGVESKRPDIVCILDAYEFTIDEKNTKFLGTVQPTLAKGYEGTANIDTNTGEGPYAHTNVAVWTQYFKISDQVFTGRDIYVTPSYFLSKLIPFNDITYGVQYPTAGLRRGILEDAIYVNENPTPADKEALFKNRVNYCEKSSREYAFMSQRTWDASTEDGYTSLSFLNNVRALERMKKDLLRLGREYLFEHNDSVTLSQMSNVLNRYMSTWLANRTLSYADVTVSPNAYSTEAVDVNLVIKFNNTIEVISVDIVIE